MEQNENNLINHQQDKKALFMCLLLDIHQVKTHLLQYLPWMINLATHQSVKTALVNATTDIQTQLLRLDVCYKIMLLNMGPVTLPVPLAINFQAHLTAQLVGLSDYMLNYKLLSHMLFVESMERTSFEVLRTLGESLKNKEVMSLISENSLEALTIKKRLYELLKLQLTNKYN